jgi:pimeloyl-ACP methyl ester carboxylesterase
MGKSAATIVLVHGAWADGSSWNRVIPLLQTKDLPVIAVQIPLTSLEDDLAATNRIVADTKGPIVLVGHSWGGMAITQAGTDPKVAALVYVSAFAPDVGGEELAKARLRHKRRHLLLGADVPQLYRPQRGAASKLTKRHAPQRLLSAIDSSADRRMKGVR